MIQRVNGLTDRNVRRNARDASPDIDPKNAVRGHGNTPHQIAINTILPRTIS
jgi:hypothetical protein